MKAISIQQPWAYAILCLGKDIENRSFSYSIRGDVLIHVGKKVDKNGVEYLKYQGFKLPYQFQTGGIVGAVEIMDCVVSSNSKWFFGKYGYVLVGAVELPFKPLKGQLGFFEVDYNGVRELIKEARNQQETY